MGQGDAVGSAEKWIADTVAAVDRTDFATDTICKVLEKAFTEISEAEYDQMSAVHVISAFVSCAWRPGP
ncbi:hypothetical protein WL56_05635 [Burkholderia cepacia]|nr:hypothetical protein WL56_05635 [Burkholderia cepacia]